MPNKYETPIFVDVPIKIGSISFWPPTIQAYMWLEDFAFKWWTDDEDMDLLSVGYALAHAKDVGAFRKLLVRRVADKAVRRWALWRLHCPKEKLRFVVNQVLGDIDRFETDKKKKKKDVYESGDWGDILALLCSTYQEPADAFLRKYSASTCMGLFKKAQIIQSAQNGGGVGNEDEKRVFHEMRMAIKYLKDKYTEEKEAVESRIAASIEDE